MKAAVVLGTRPEIIKLSPVIRELQSRGIDYVLIHSGQHYSPNMDAVFFEDLELPAPNHHLELGKLDYRRRVGHGIREIMRIYEEESVDCTIVEGDTLTVLIGALAANRLGIPVAHVEAGLRSHDLNMPEEVNRIITDHISTFLFPPTTVATGYLEEEGIAATPVGNTVVDAVKQNLEISKGKSSILEDLGVKDKGYILITSHRAENVDDKDRLEGILEGIDRVAKKHQELEAIFPIHPRTEKRMQEFGVMRPESIRFIEPVGYLDFLQLQAGARIILTDSGGIQEEASVLHVPCVTLRDNTERPETVTAGMNMLAGADPDLIAECTEKMLEKAIEWQDVYGDGSAAKRIIDRLEDAT